MSMDPLTLIGLIAAAADLADMGADLCISLKGMARTFLSAPEAIFPMTQGVSSLVSLLQEIQTALENGNSNGLVLSREARIDLQNILENCKLVLASMKMTLDKFEHYPKEFEGASTTVTRINAIRLRFQWMIEESEMVRIRDNVQTLQLTLTATTALVYAATKRDKMEINTRLKDLRSSLKTSETALRPRSPSPKRRLPVMTVPGKTLFLAARAGHKNIFLRILQSGAKITEVESDGTTVLQAAAEENQLDVVLSLLFFGADPNLGGRGGFVGSRGRSECGSPRGSSKDEKRIS
ncbi:hypothetical protein FOVG_18863 [Fusarium oxysporum f. sp. pisi HDV247]|uniref:Uncharacterized protein n=1 Tax=Fusarium oxysporum f. sp. pisi HDV247 TaxID=1080344 RepID=W9NI20_FUSOX|nr:hypothetical protein FOVG_18863 [Fusarium oxysporum f. sp. pisi HDV247]